MKNLLAIISDIAMMDITPDLTPANVKPTQPKNLKAYTAKWSGANLGNKVTVTATITLNLDLINNPGLVRSAVGARTAFHSIQVEVTGATDPDANGLFTTNDFGRAVLRFISPVDLSRELVGQQGFSGIISELNLFQSVLNPAAPTASSFNKLQVFGGEEVVLTSFAPAAVDNVAATPAANFPTLLDMSNMALYCR